jgi:hypothetical protein
VKIWDTFMVGDDLDLLECRLDELDAAPVHRFVLCESPVTFQGRPKPLCYAESGDRFAAWKDRIIHLTAPVLPGATGPWERERYQRDHLLAGLAGAAPDDIVLHGDVDEIPRAEAIGTIAAGAHGIVLGMPQHIFAVDWLDPRGEWPGTVVLRRDQVTTITAMRDLRNSLPRMARAGWHLTWLGGPAAITAKVNSFSHREIVPLVTRAAAAGDLYERGRFWSSNTELGIQLDAAGADGAWPRWVRERRCPENWFRPR